MAYNNLEYWNKLVGSNMNLKEVGWPNWTIAFNKARYKLTANQTLDVLTTFNLTEPKKILEIGCGVGFWTNLLTLKYPNAQYVGIDISQNSIHNLNLQYKENELVQFVLQDVGKELVLDNENEYDLVVCMEVLLHITDDIAWKNAVNNLLLKLKIDGLLLLSEPFLYWSTSTFSAEKNHKLRMYSDFKLLFDKHSIEVIKIQSRTFLLDNNIDFKTKIGEKSWKIFFKFWNKMLCIKNENLGSLLGKIAYFIDQNQTKINTIGNSCRLIVGKKR